MIQLLACNLSIVCRWKIQATTSNNSLNFQAAIYYKDCGDICNSEVNENKTSTY